MCRIDDEFTINPDVMSKKLGSQIVTLNVKTHQYHVLNEAAAQIFEMATTGKNTVEKVSHKLAETAKIGKDVALEDTRETIDGMVKLGLLVGKDVQKGGYARPAVRAITEDDLKTSIASGAKLVCRSLLGA
jgi:RimJ/RimL family protein N-acetyltransferase